MDKWVAPAIVFDKQVKSWLLTNIALLYNIEEHYDTIHEATGLARWQIYYFASMMNQMLSKNAHRLGYRREMLGAFEVEDKDDLTKEEYWAIVESMVEKQKYRKGMDHIYPEGQVLHLANLEHIAKRFIKNNDVLIIDEAYEKMLNLIKQYIRGVILEAQILSRSKPHVASTHVKAKTKININEDVMQTALQLRPPLSGKDYVTNEYAEIIYELIDMRRKETTNINRSIHSSSTSD